MGTADGDENHFPAVEDWPRGYGEASVWPFVTAIGAAGIYVAAALFVLGAVEPPVVDPVFGPVAAVAATLLFLVGLYGWTYHAFVKAYWDTARDGVSLRLGMLLFLGTEVATFGAGFIYYFVIRSSAWTDLPELVTSGSILSTLVIVNTVVLVLSSVTMHVAHLALRTGNRTRFIRLLGLTLVLGIAFIAGQAYEYYEFVIHKGFTAVQGVYASAFFGLTGLHGLHVSLGAVLLGVVFVRALSGQYDAERHTSVSTVSMYWHFVDAIWVFLVVVLYAGAVIQV